MNSKEEEFYYQQSIREGRCIDCGAKIAVIEGKRTACDCKPKRPSTEQEKNFVDWFEHMAKTTKRPMF